MTTDKWTDGTDSFIQKSFLDAKGDLISATADNTPAILSVGTNEFNLEADSGEATGLKWSSRAKDAEIIAYLGL